MRKAPFLPIAIGIATVLLPAAHAQFGSGIVFDPTQSGHAVVQIEHEEQSISNQMQQIENGQQIFSNTVKIATTALQTYNQIKQQNGHTCRVASSRQPRQLPPSMKSLAEFAKAEIILSRFYQDHRPSHLPTNTSI